MYGRFVRAGPVQPTAESAVSARIRRIHRWFAIFFILTVVLNFAFRAVGPSPDWVTYSPLPFLFVQMLTGLCLLAQPLLRRQR